MLNSPPFKRKGASAKERSHASEIVSRYGNTYLASFTLFKQQLEDVRLAFKADKYFGLANRGTTHSGLQVVQPISPNGALGPYAFHVAICTLVITLAEC